MSERCQKCFRPQAFCLCAYTREIDTGIKFVFLMHPKEQRRQRTGTGRLSHISLKNAETLVGVDFTQNQRLLTRATFPCCCIQPQTHIRRAQSRCSNPSAQKRCLHSSLMLRGFAHAKSSNTVPICLRCRNCRFTAATAPFLHLSANRVPSAFRLSKRVITSSRNCKANVSAGLTRMRNR